MDRAGIDIAKLAKYEALVTKGALGFIFLCLVLAFALSSLPNVPANRGIIDGLIAAITYFAMPGTVLFLAAAIALYCIRMSLKDN